MISIRQLFVLSLVIGLLFLAPHSVVAQNRTTRILTGQGTGPGGSQGPQLFGNDPAMANLLILAEGAIDPSAYIVGPGDQFSIFIGGPVPIQALVPISISGKLIAMDAGSIEAAGKSLQDVQKETTDLLRAQYSNVAIDVSLIQPRRFYVHVSGSVPEPGRYPMLPLSRLDDAIQQAFAAQTAARPDPTSNNEVRIVGSATAEMPATRPEFKPSLRNVTVTSSLGETNSYDLFRYYVHGDLDHNPYLQDGDVIQLNAYDEVRNAILITGDVASPGQIEYREGDSVLDVLRLVAGDLDLNSVKTVRLTRRTENSIAPPVDLDIPAMLRGSTPATDVQMGDHLNVAMEETATAAVYGFVQFPGTYPIQNAQTTLRELIELAGGLKDEASIKGAYIERRQSLSSKPTTEGSKLDFFERAYFRESLAKNRISIDIATALEAASPEILLYSGDVIVFPRDEQTVYVTGNVLNPGYIPYVPDMTVNHYIQQAGGMGPLTTGILVFEVGSGKVHSNISAIIRPGDTIFINREAMTDNPELQALLLSDEASQRAARIARTQTIITGVTALVSVVNTFLLIRDRLNN